MRAIAVAIPRVRAWATDFFRRSKTYIVIILAGMIISMFYNICAGVLRAVGDTVSPLIFLIISTIANIELEVKAEVAF